VQKGNHKGLPLRNYNRRSIRLKHYDYSKAGCYFVTICTHDRLHLFGEMVDGNVVLSLAGEMVNTLWYEIMHDFQNVYLHEFVIMPNHIHGIIEIVDTVGVPLVGTLNTANTIGIHDKNASISRAPIKGAPTVGDVIGAFKSKTTNEYIKMVKNKTLPPFQKRIWQRNYYEHVIHDENDYMRIAEYIINNPITWENDVLSTNES
jgi:REP element-mobilizing transposase RayT